jgi:hypothetical protein
MVLKELVCQNSTRAVGVWASPWCGQPILYTHPNGFSPSNLRISNWRDLVCIPLFPPELSPSAYSVNVLPSAVSTVLACVATKVCKIYEY